jgi:N-carbamoyl-L-amino-acid hydrolase
VGTVGNLTVHPGASNVIPGRVDLTVEIRALDEKGLDAAEADLRAQAELGQLSRKPPVACSEQVIAALERVAAGLQLRSLRIPSGAGHDAMCMAALCPVGMLFVPSQGGHSHRPDELTLPEHIGAGVEVLVRTLFALAYQGNARRR